MTASPIPSLTIDCARIIADAVRSSRRKAVSLSTGDTRDLADAFVSIDAMAKLVAEYLAARDEMFRAGESGDVAGEQAADERLDKLEPQMIERLVALGYLHFHPEQEAPDGQEG